MPQIHGYLFFDGNCAEAMRFYQRTLGGKLDLMTAGQSPAAEHLPPGSADKIIHAHLATAGGGVLMASDWMAGEPWEPMRGFSLSLDYPTVADAEPVFKALLEGGKETMPFGSTFWAEAFGMLVDRYGTHWMVNVAKPSA
jgi:PhnB protein